MQSDVRLKITAAANSELEVLFWMTHSSLWQSLLNVPLFLSCSHLESTLNPSSSLKFKNVFKSSFKTVFTLLVHLSAKLAFLAAVWWMRALERENTSMAAAWCSSSEQAAVLQNNSTTQRSSHNSLLSPPPSPQKNIFSSSYMHHDPVRLSRMWTQSDSGSLVASRLLEIDPWSPLLLCSHAQFSCSESSREQLERRSDDCYNSQSDDNREKQVESSPVGSSSSVCRCVFMAVNGALDVSPNIFSSLRREQYDCKTRDNSSAPWRGNCSSLPFTCCFLQAN